MRDDGSIEHILCESKDIEYSLNIGNLILLEIKINNNCDNINYQDKIKQYANSNYEVVKEFIKQYGEMETWGKAEIQNRAKVLANIVYYEVINFS